VLFYKGWFDTRWRFLVGVAVLMLSACATVFAYPKLAQLVGRTPLPDATTELGRRIRDAALLSRTYRGYIWSQWYAQNLPQLWTVFAVLLGTAGLWSPSSGSIYTLSMPVSRRALLMARAAIALTELLLLAAMPSLALALLSPAVGQTYGLLDALAHGVCLFAGGAVFFALAFLLSAVFTDVWRPILIALATAVTLALCEPFIGVGPQFSIVRVMTGETYFRTGHLPWGGLLLASAASSAMMVGAAVRVYRRDF
jgi:hypothetical protein